ncbi:MAG: AmmeMemoRadiSam system radical SAM enzyme [Treponema sp.]|jgi:pyruvate formate lyase activating enzyme|nr:AmmeMemoRadiSam system radical SAM enzyme [Treponema sp.]
MHRTALFLGEEAEGVVRCSLCPRRCAIPSGALGACGVRGNKNGKGLVPLYGHITALALDPIEKKPLFHFRPGSMILSAGFAGCNLRCPFCQNWHISQSADAPGRQMLPGDLISAALRENSTAIAYTYSEPLVHAEFLLDCMTLAHRHGIANVLVSNGCANAEAAGEILSLTDAANIDLKCFSADTYAKVLGGVASERSAFETVLAFIRLACSTGVHVEVTTLVVPGLNDTIEELDLCADFIASLASQGAADVPWHLSAYHPDYRWNAPPTDPALLRRTRERAGNKLTFIYAGNTGDENDTVCPHCGAILIRRRGYQTYISGLAAVVEGERFFRCAQCDAETPVNH